MKAGLVFLVLAYVLSQFYRAFLAVMAPALLRDVGVGPEVLSMASGLWFIAFAAMQIPVGWALDHVGPRWTASAMLGLGGAGGALVFAVAQGPWAIYVAMVLIGIGCSPVLMASYYIFARVYSPAVFGTLAGAVIGFGSLGNLAGSVPLAMAVEGFGWRETLTGLAAVTLAVALAIAVFVKDPERPEPTATGRGSLMDLLKIPALWFILPMMLVNYAPSAALRGLWVGPYLGDVYGYDASGIGRITLLMGAAMIVGNFAYGPMDRVFGTRKWVVLTGNLLGAACLLALWLYPEGNILRTALLVAAVGLFGASFPLVMAHGRSFVPAHLTGRGVTLLNLFGIGGVGFLQFFSGRMHAGLLAVGYSPTETYGLLFLGLALVLLSGCAVYLFSSDSDV
ncbi:MAG: MFS transporter [Paracoccaceae bacterium]